MVITSFHEYSISLLEIGCVNLLTGSVLKKLNPNSASYIAGLVQERHNSNALAPVSFLFNENPYTWKMVFEM